MEEISCSELRRSDSREVVEVVFAPGLADFLGYVSDRMVVEDKLWHTALLKGVTALLRTISMAFYGRIIQASAARLLRIFDVRRRIVKLWKVCRRSSLALPNFERLDVSFLSRLIFDLLCIAWKHIREPPVSPPDILGRSTYRDDFDYFIAANSFLLCRVFSTVDVAICGAARRASVADVL